MSGHVRAQLNWTKLWLCKPWACKATPAVRFCCVTPSDSSCDPTPSSEPAKSTRVVRHVSAFSTAPMTPDLCGRRHFLPFWSAGAGTSVEGHAGLSKAQSSQEQISAFQLLLSCCDCCRAAMRHRVSTSALQLKIRDAQGGQKQNSTFQLEHYTSELL